jgi:DNA-binding MarR family transcriptional regulator
MPYPLTSSHVDVWAHKPSQVFRFRANGVTFFTSLPVLSGLPASEPPSREVAEPSCIHPQVRRRRLCHADGISVDLAPMADENDRIALPCMCANVRRASRVLTQLYDKAMRPLGSRATQFSILQALSLTGPKPLGELAEFLALDTTTLTRAVQLLRKHGWVEASSGKDQRERWLRLSKAGKAELKRLQPAWEAVQKDVRLMLGQQRWDGLFQLSTRVANISAKPRERSKNE